MKSTLLDPDIDPKKSTTPVHNYTMYEMALSLPLGHSQDKGSGGGTGAPFRT